MKQVILVRIVLTVTIVLITAGCEFSSPGAKVFAGNRCPQCHTIRGKGGHGGPDLSYVGSKRSKEFILQQIRNPKMNDQNTNMPSFPELSEQEIRDLAEYLSRLK